MKLGLWFVDVAFYPFLTFSFSDLTLGRVSEISCRFLSRKTLDWQCFVVAIGG